MSRHLRAWALASGIALAAPPALATECRPVTPYADFCVAGGNWDNAEWFDIDGWLIVMQVVMFVGFAPDDPAHDTPADGLVDRLRQGLFTQIYPGIVDLVPERDAFAIGGLSVTRHVWTAQVSPTETAKMIGMVVSTGDRRLLVQLGLPGVLPPDHLDAMATDVIRRLRIRSEE